MMRWIKWDDKLVLEEKLSTDLFIALLNTGGFRGEGRINFPLTFFAVFR